MALFDKKVPKKRTRRSKKILPEGDKYCYRLFLINDKEVITTKRYEDTKEFSKFISTNPYIDCYYRGYEPDKVVTFKTSAIIGFMKEKK